MGIAGKIKKAVKKVTKKASNAVTDVAKKTGIKDYADSKSGTLVGTVIKKGASGIDEVARGSDDLASGILSGDMKKIKEGTTEIIQGGMKANLAVMSPTTTIIADKIQKGQAAEQRNKDKAKAAAKSLQEKQQELAAVQKDEEVRRQLEAEQIARRNMYREHQKQQATLQNVAGQTAFKSSAMAGVQSSIGTAFASGGAQLSSDLRNNINYIETTYKLGGDISAAQYRLAEYNQRVAENAAGTAGVIGGAVSGAQAGAMTGNPWAIGAGAILGAAAGGGGFKF